MCDIRIKDGIKAAQDCKCYQAVMKAYGGMTKAGQPHKTALEAAAIVYSYHHPDENKEDRFLTVERWISQEHLH